VALMLALTTGSGCASGGGASAGSPGVDMERSDEGTSITIGMGQADEEPALDRSQPPALGRIRDVALPAVDTFRLANGLLVAFAPRPRSPLVSFELRIPGGSSTDEPTVQGRAALMADLLDEGAGGRTGVELAAAVGALGGELETFADEDATHVSLSGLSRASQSLMALLADVVVRPELAETDFGRVRDLRLARLAHRADDAADVADDAFVAAVYGADPYGVPPLGTPSGLQALTSQHVRDFARATLSPQDAQLVVVGGISIEALKEQAEATFGAWGGQGEPLAVPPALPESPSAPRVVLIDRPGAEQSELRVGRTATTRADPEHASLHVLNTILGGAFTSRLNVRLREEKGFSYDVSSTFDSALRRGVFAVETSVHTPATAEAVQVILAELADLTTHSVDSTELERAKRYVALRLPAQFETGEQVSDRISELLQYGIALEEYEGYAARIMEVTASDVLRAARRFLDPDGMVVVVVGDARVIRTSLVDLGRPLVEDSR